MLRPRLVTFLLGTILSLLLGLTLGYLGFQDNNQSEFYDYETGVWNLPNTLLLVFLPLLLWVSIFILGRITLSLLKRAKKILLN